MNTPRTTIAFAVVDRRGHLLGGTHAPDAWDHAQAAAQRAADAAGESWLVCARGWTAVRYYQRGVSSRAVGT